MNTHMNLTSTRHSELARFELDSLLFDTSSWLFHIGRHRIANILANSLRPFSTILELGRGVRYGFFRAHNSSDAAQIAEPDAVVLSYALTQTNPGWQQLILDAKTTLGIGGKVAIVDFYDSPNALFRKWMGNKNVNADQEILPFLHENFSLRQFEVRPACFGLWTYFIYIGEVKSDQVVTFGNFLEQDDTELL